MNHHVPDHRTDRSRLMLVNVESGSSFDQPSRLEMLRPTLQTQASPYTSTTYK